MFLPATSHKGHTHPIFITFLSLSVLFAPGCQTRHRTGLRDRTQKSTVREARLPGTVGFAAVRHPPKDLLARDHGGNCVPAGTAGL